MPIAFFLYHGQGQKFNEVKTGWYKSMAVVLAQALGFNVSLATETPNCIEFDSFWGNSVFGDIIDVLYDRKRRSRRKMRAKLELNSLIGRLAMMTENYSGKDCKNSDDQRIRIEVHPNGETDNILNNLDPNDIIYIHTDGFVSAQQLDESLLGANLGDLKLEKTGILKIDSGRKKWI
eukprot:gene10310-2454_t